MGVRALRLELSKYLNKVDQGEEIVVTDRGRPIARIVPVRGSSTERLAELIEAGEAEGATTSQDDWLPQPIELAPGATVSDLVADQRR